MPPPNSAPAELPPLAAAGDLGAILERLQALSPKPFHFSLGRVQRLLAALGHPERRAPPVVHVAGTNGKGSTCAFLRAIGEAAGFSVHVTTSPHLIHVRERFRLAGRLVDDAVLAATLAEIEAVNAGAPITALEALAACAYLLFSRAPADLCVVEVGRGGRLDATNVVEAPACAVITSLSLDHQEFLGDTLERIAWEKAGVMKPGRPCVTGAHPPGAAAVLERRAAQAGARLLVHGRDWRIAPHGRGLRYQDAAGTLDLPPPALLGAHQVDNAGLAVAALRASGLGVPDAGWQGLSRAEWPARLQRLEGRLARRLPPDFELWLDGGHNPGAGAALARQLEAWSDRPVYLVIGMKQTRYAASFLTPLLAGAVGLWAVAEPAQHLALAVDAIIAASGARARAGPDIAGALAQVARLAPGRVLVCGSLYLASEVLKMDGREPR